MLTSRICYGTVRTMRGFQGPVRRATTNQVRFFSQRVFAPTDTFIHRHIGPSSKEEIDAMTKAIGVESMDALMDLTVPENIRLKEPMPLGEHRGEAELLQEFKDMMGQNKVFRSHIGNGYYNTHTPLVILRNMIENPAWYTPYTPYQPEISQGRLEMLLNFQTMVSDLTGLPVSNSSLLDEGTAAAEAMNMCWAGSKKKKRFLVADDCHPQTIAILNTRAEPLDLIVDVRPVEDFSYDSGDVFGVLVQYPGTTGVVRDYAKLAEEAHAVKAKVVAASDLLALTLLNPPGEWGADVCVGNSQRFGVPMGFGGPHAGFLSTSEANKRKLPGRVIGVSRDSRGLPALRMAMQTREQHIRRDKATSNICTAQALLANVAAAYAVYHGPDGLTKIAKKVHAAARCFTAGVKDLGLNAPSDQVFDTVHVNLNGAGNALAYQAAAEEGEFNIRVIDDDNVCVSFDETTTAEDINQVVHMFASVAGVDTGFDAETVAQDLALDVAPQFARSSDFLTHPIFNMHKSETDMMRYLHQLSSKDLGLQTAMIPLGSCTMKLNAAVEMIPITWPEVNQMHPFAPVSQSKGYAEMLETLEADLCVITGFARVSLQPNAGAQGEYTGLLSIREYHRSRGDTDRKICLIPISAHGTNPASAVMAGMKVVVVGCDDKGNVDMTDFHAKVKKHQDKLAALMITYPSTHGVFEESIREICDTIHEAGGMVYMDGANMNAQVGLTSPGFIGADVCHLNLHKTFCIPHGGGGPGMGPIGVVKALAPFLPTHPLRPDTGGEHGIGAVAAAPFSSASILPISWMYCRLMGADGLLLATKHAILAANYMAVRLGEHYKILYTGENKTCAHEFIIDLRDIKKTTGIVEEDVAKRLMDFNFHSPTMSFPVAGTLMVEPTESEPLYELDRFCDAMIIIRQEIRAVETGASDKKDNPLKNAPHTADMALANEWDHSYSREQAAYPASYLRQNKFWPSVGRLDNVFGDRNVICTCPPLESYSAE